MRHIVKFSGLSAADGGTPFVFGSMHAEIERYLEGSGLSWTHLRPSQFMTEYLREVPTILTQSGLFLPLEDAKLVPRGHRRHRESCLYAANHTRP